MTSSVVDEWFSSDDWIPFDMWVDVLDSIEAELDVGSNRIPQPPQHPIFGRNTPTQQLYIFLLPADSVKRIRSASDLYAEINELVEEVITYLKPDLMDPIEPTHRLAIFQRIAGRFRGNMDFTRIDRDSIEWPTEPEFDPPRGSVNVTIESINKNNLRDIEIYSVDSAPEFFESTWAHNAYMFHRLRDSKIEPEVTVSNIALHSLTPKPAEQRSANRVDLSDFHSAPDFPIATVDEDPRGRWTLSKIKNPRSVFDDAYGNIEAMGDILSHNEDASEHVWSGQIHYQVAAGIRW